MEMTAVDLITIASLVLAVMVMTLWIVTAYLAGEAHAHERRSRSLSTDGA